MGAPPGEAIAVTASTFDHLTSGTSPKHFRAGRQNGNPKFGWRHTTHLGTYRSLWVVHDHAVGRVGRGTTGEDFAVVGRPREVPLLGRSVGTALLWRDQYEVRVDAWPRRTHRALWRVIVRGETAERLGGEVAEAISSGRWHPGRGERPVAYTSRKSSRRR